MLDLKQYYHDALRKCGYGKTYSHSSGDGMRTQTQLPSGQRGSKAWKWCETTGFLDCPKPGTWEYEGKEFPNLKDSRALIGEQMVTHFGCQNTLIHRGESTQWLLP